MALYPEEKYRKTDECLELYYFIRIFATEMLSALSKIEIKMLFALSKNKEIMLF